MFHKYWVFAELCAARQKPDLRQNAELIYTPCLTPNSHLNYINLDVFLRPVTVNFGVHRMINARRRLVPKLRSRGNTTPRS